MSPLIIIPIFFAMLLTTLLSFGSDKSNYDQSETEHVTLIDFSDTSTAYWQIVNDSVMGGISRSQLRLHDEGFAIFSGTVSLKNNGGFASVRTQAQNSADLSSFDGLSVKVLGDGKTYCIRIRTVKNGRITRYSYESRFTTTKGQWETHHLPYSSFKAIFRGNSVRGNPELNSNAIIEIGFMIRDGQEGPFELAIRELAAYR